MYKYCCLNSISETGLKQFDGQYVKTEVLEEADILLVRSAKMHEISFGDHVKAIARVGAGVNNIPLEECAEKGIVVFNTPGANANAVKELVLAGLLLSARDIAGGIRWVYDNKGAENLPKLTEEKKKVFSGFEIMGKKIGVIGLGAIGVLVANAAASLGMEVYGYDPYLSVDTAWKLSRDVRHATNIEELYKECDYLTLHIPALESTKGIIDKTAFDKMKNNVILLNFSRDSLVNTEDLLAAIEEGKVLRYVTDFPVSKIAGRKQCIVLPHLGASTKEAESNCAKMAVCELREFLENGNIIHSVNFPDCSLGKKEEGTRITIIHRNIPNMIGQFTTILAEAQKNITVMANKSKQNYAYTMLDVEGAVEKEVVERLRKVKAVLKIRVL